VTGPGEIRTRTTAHDDEHDVILLKRSIVVDFVLPSIRLIATVAVTFTCLSGARPLAQTALSTWDQVAKGEPISFATSLVTAGVPVGAELSVADMTPTVRPDVTRLSTRPPDVNVLVQIFNEAHAEYVAAIIGNVVVIRPSSLGLAYLDVPLRISPLVTTGAILALKHVFGPIQPSLAGDVIAGSRSVDPEEAGDLLTITFTPGGKVLDALNDLAVQASAGWLVATARDTQSATILAEVALIYRGGSITGFKLLPRNVWESLMRQR